jgi:hypothetical protein
MTVVASPSPARKRRGRMNLPALRRDGIPRKAVFDDGDGKQSLSFDGLRS